MKRSIPPDTLYYVAPKNASISILNGLIPHENSYVHLTSDVDYGKLHDSPIVIVIDAEKMQEEGYEFYHPAEDVWLVDEVPSRFFDAFQTQIWANKNKAIKIVCDSDDIIEELKREYLISTSCEIVHLSQTSFAVHTWEEYFMPQIYVIILTDKYVCDNELLNKIADFQKNTYGTLLILPQSTNKIPSICESNLEKIYNILRFFVSLLIGDCRMRVDFADIYTVLFKDGGEIKFLQPSIKTSLDMIHFWDKLIDLVKSTKNQLKACMIHLSLPKDCNTLMESIWCEFDNGLRLTHNLFPNIDWLRDYSSDTGKMRMLMFLR